MGLRHALRSRVPTRICYLAAATLVCSALGCSLNDTPGTEKQDEPEVTGSAAAEAGGLWVDPDSPAARQVELWEEEGRGADAQAVRWIAEQPVADWPTGERDPGPEVRAVADAARKAGQTAVFVAYNIPHRDCGQYSSGGAENSDAYGEWIGSFAEQLGDTEAMVILEPDAVPHLLDGCTAEMYADKRYELLTEAVERLKQQPGTRVYLDAGNPTWITDPGQLAEALRRAGIERADGFALNVANFRSTEDSLEYGQQLAGLLDDAHFVIDTSRNGNGALDDGSEEAWCNPPGRALGTPPTMDTGEPLVDAYLWIKRPGESDGQCRGGPAAGQWWPEYALKLVQEAGADTTR